MLRKAVVSVAAIGVVAVVFSIVSCGESSTSSGGMGEPRVVRAAETGGPGAATKLFGAGGEVPQTSTGMSAVEHAGAVGKYVFVFFYGNEDDQTAAMRKVFNAAVRDMGDRCESVAVDVTDPSESALVERFRASRAPMPMVLAVAPNGAVTGAIATEFNEEQLMGALVSPCTEQCLGALQAGRAVLLCIQSDATGFNEEAMQGVSDFVADARFAESADVVILDPTDPDEAKFLERLEVDAQTRDALTVILVPPGTAVAKFTGQTSKDELAGKLQAGLAGSGCGPGSSPGCCPKK